jgi:putative DNA primase/helicase
MNGETIARGLGLHRAGSGKWHGKCPSCGYRTGFSVTEQRDGLPLVYCHAGGCSQSDLLDALRRTGLWPESKSQNGDRVSDRQRRHRVSAPAAFVDTTMPAASPSDMALSLWRRTTAVEATFVPPIVADYLRKTRGYTGPIPTVLRQLNSAKHPTGTYTPAMIALVEHVDNGPVAVHRTFLRADGSGKADLDPNKMTLGPSKGAAVQLAKPRDGVLGVAEGIESALSYMQVTAVPTWAALSAVGIRNLILPPEVSEIIIAADPDPVGLMAARAAARRWLDEGRRVSIARPPLGLDFNDLVRRAA